MEQNENQISSSSMPVLPRLDRLDRLLKYLEEMQRSSGRHSSEPVPTEVELKEQCKTISSALEEVHFKGTLMERVAMLEKRVLELSLAMEEGNTSRSGIPTLPVPENCRYGLPPMQDREVLCAFEENQDHGMKQGSVFDEAKTSHSQGYRKRRHRKTLLTTRHRKWLGWFQMGC